MSNTPKFDGSDAMEIEPVSGPCVARSTATARHGWSDQFAVKAEAGDDCLLDGQALPATEWEATQWEW